MNAFDAFVFDQFVGERVCVGLLRYEVDFEFVLFDLTGCGRAHGGNTHWSETANIVVRFIEKIEEILYPVRAGEDHPFVNGDTCQYFADTLAIEVLLDGNEGKLDNFSALIGEHFTKFSCLFACAGDDDALAKEGAAFEPFGFSAVCNDLTNDDHCRRTDTRRSEIFDD